MIQEEFIKLKEMYSKKWADAHFNSFREYDWDKFIRVEDYASPSHLTKNKYELYKNNQVITPYLDENKKYKVHSGKENILMAQYTSFGIDGFYQTFYQECLKDVSIRWNIWEFTLYSSGEYQSAFSWDNEANIDNLLEMPRNYLDNLAEDIGFKFFDLSVGKIFTKGIVIIDIVNNEVKMETFFYDNQIVVHQTPMLVDESWIGTILQVQEGTKNPELGANVIIWNRMIIDIPWSKTDRNGVFDVKRDIKLEWREENA